MKTNKKYLTLLLALGFVGLTYAQDNGDSAEGEPTTIQSLLELVKQGRTSEQNANSQREKEFMACLLYTSPSPRDKRQSRMPSSA